MAHGRVVWHENSSWLAPWEDPIHPRKTQRCNLDIRRWWLYKDLHQSTVFFFLPIFLKNPNPSTWGRGLWVIFTQVVFLTQWIWDNKICKGLSNEIFLSSGNLNRLTLATSQHPAWGNYRSLSYPLTWKTAIATLTVNFHQLETPTTRHFQECLLKKTVYQKFNPDVGEYSIHGSLWVSPSLDSHPVANLFSHDARWTCNHRSLGTRRTGTESSVVPFWHDSLFFVLGNFFQNNPKKVGER